MKKIKIWSMMMLAVMTLPLILACGGDNDDTSVRDQLIGIWSTTMTSGNWNLIELKADGSIEYNLHKKADGTIESSGLNHAKDTHWIYNESDQTITMYRDDNYYHYIYKVSMANDGNSWNGTDPSTGKIYSFMRIASK